MRAKKHLGQHFLKDQHYLSELVESVGVVNESSIVEIGPGLGHLTSKLINFNKRLFCIEKDAGLMGVLKNKFGNKIELILADALEFDWNALDAGEINTSKILIANLPYNISVPLIMRFLQYKIFFRQCVLIQKEVALRLSATFGSRDYGRISVLAQTFGNVKCCFDIPGNAFTPTTKVNSTFIILEQKESDIEFASFSNMLNECFAHRRKMIRGFVSEDIIKALSILGVPNTVRAEEVSVEQYQACYRVLRENKM